MKAKTPALETKNPKQTGQTAIDQMKPIVVSWATPATRLYLSQGNSHEVASFDDDDSVQLPVIDSRDQPLSRLKIFLSQLDSACVQSHTVRFHV